MFQIWLACQVALHTFHFWHHRDEPRFRTNKNELKEKSPEEAGFVLNVQSSNAESYFLDLVNVTRESIDSIEVEELVK